MDIQTCFKHDRTYIEKCDICERDREIERLGSLLSRAHDELLALATTSQTEAAELRASLQAALQRAEKAEANLEAQQQITRNTAKAANEARGDHFDAESALAAARKALDTAWAAMCERRGYADAWEWKYGTTWNEEDAEVRAAIERINGEGHESA